MRLCGKKPIEKGDAGVDKVNQRDAAKAVAQHCRPLSAGRAFRTIADMAKMGRKNHVDFF
jgi:hypothetical protein